MTAAVTQAEFARHIGVGRSYVTALKTSGRLVMDDEGRVLVEESKALLAKTNGAPERAAVVPKEFSDSRSRREHIEAELKQIELDEKRQRLVVAAEVIAVVSDVATILRAGMESLPDRLAPQLAAASDEQQIRAMLADEIEMALSGMSARFSEMAKAA